MKIPSLFDKAVIFWPGNNIASTTNAKTITRYATNSGYPIYSTAVPDPFGGSDTTCYVNGVYSSSSGNVSRLVFPASSDMVFSGDFAIEFRIRVTASQIEPWPTIISNRNNADSGSDIFLIMVDATGYDGKIVLYWAGDTSYNLSNTTNIIDDTWHHVLVQRIGTTMRICIDGVSEASNTFPHVVSFNLTPNEMLGRARSSTTMTGPLYLSEFRISDCARYTEFPFTPPTSRFVNDNYTRLLLHLNESGTTYTDSSFLTLYDEFPILPSGTTITKDGTWLKTNLGNSKSLMKFSGTNFVALSDSDSLTLGTSDFTAIMFVKIATGSRNNHVFWQSPSNNDPATSSIGFRIDDSNVAYWFYSNGTTNLTISAKSTAVNVGDWNCFVLRRASNVLYTYCNGVLVTSTAFTGTIPNSTVVFTIGRAGDYTGADYYFIGNISSFILTVKALSVEEIVAINKLMHPVTGINIIPGPYDYWRLTA